MLDPDALTVTQEPPEPEAPAEVPPSDVPVNPSPVPESPVAPEPAAPEVAPEPSAPAEPETPPEPPDARQLWACVTAQGPRTIWQGVFCPLFHSDDHLDHIPVQCPNCGSLSVRPINPGETV